MRIAAYTLPWRIVAGLLVAIAGSNLVGLLFLETTRAIPAIVTVRTFLYFTAIPLGAACALARLAAATAAIRDDRLVLDGRGLRVEVPLGAIADVRAWRIPLPRPGLAVRLASGRWLPYGLAIGDPALLLTALADAGVAGARPRRASLPVVYAHAAAVAPSSVVDRPVAKFVVFALVPAAVAFSLDQHISYGGLWGQYYLEGPWPWLRSFLTMWGAAGIDLVLYATVWRVPAEVVGFAVTAAAPSRARGVRRAVEVVCRVAFYVGIPALLAIRLEQ